MREVTKLFGFVLRWILPEVLRPIFHNFVLKTAQNSQ